jgi:hypothetical protein
MKEIYLPANSGIFKKALFDSDQRVLLIISTTIDSVSMQQTAEGSKRTKLIKYQEPSLPQRILKK